MKENFFQRLHANKDKLTRKQQLLAKYIVDNYTNVVFLSCTELGKKINASDATVIRFAYTLGYSGFLEMITSLQSEFNGEMSSISRIEALHSPEKYLTHINFHKIQRCFADAIQSDYFKSLVDDLLSSSKFIIMGSESTASLADYLNYHLIRYGISSDVINNNSEKIYKIYREADDNTTVLSLSLRRYTKFQYHVTKALIDKSLKVYSITDSINSPYNALNNKCIVLNSSTKEGFNHLSHTVLILVLQELIRKTIVNINKDEICKHFDALEEYNDVMNIFIKNKF